MSEVYTLPAMYFLFEEDNPVEAFDVVKQGISDPRVRPQVHLLAAFVSHAFLRDTVAAGQHYRTLADMAGVPPWVGDLADKLASGRDPLAENPKLASFMCKLIEKSFPRARQYLTGKRRECGWTEESP